DMMVTVCANTEWTCEDGACFRPCKTDTQCKASVGHPKCNVNTGLCECASDNDCWNSGLRGHSACHHGVCGCAGDSDCKNLLNGDICFDGVSGCSSADWCSSTNVFDNTTKVCEGA